jgi:hypothetical protein
MNRAVLSAHPESSVRNTTDIVQGCPDPLRDKAIAGAVGPRSYPHHITAGRRLSGPVRLTLAAILGGAVDGAWWPRTGLISGELPDLVSVLQKRLGYITAIDVNWSPLESPPDLNWHGWRGKHQHMMTVCGHEGRAKLLVVPHLTRAALAVMVLRRAAGLPIDPAHTDSDALETADCILRVARGEVGDGT